jgi:hypothetical protein
VSSYALLDVTPVRGRHFPYWEFLTSNVMAHIGPLPEGTPVVAKEPVASRDRNGGASALAFGRRGASCVSGAARTFVLLRSVCVRPHVGMAEMVTQSSTASSSSHSLLAGMPVASRLSA